MAEHRNDSILADKKVLVIDDDEVARNLIANHLQRMGVAEVVLKVDGEEGWEALTAQAFDFIVLDWKLPKLSGLAFFNRIRRIPDYRMTPILVVSGFLERNDFRLLQEFPATGLMEKPFTVVLFQNRVEDLLRESVWYGQNVALVDTILQAVKHDPKKAEQLLKQVLKTAPNPVPLAVLAARCMIKASLLKGAQAILESVLKIDDQCVIAMNELGKVLHLMGDHKRALDMLRMANKLSPQNLQRLCLLGEVELNMKEPERARAYFQKVLDIDGLDSKAEAGLIIAGNMESMLGSTDPMQVPKSFASLMNTMGITLVRNSQFAKGIEQYQAALAFLHAKEDSARVAFNLGLGFLRWGKPNAALPWFRLSERMAPAGFGKSAAYVRKLITSGATLDVEEQNLTTPTSNEPTAKSDDASNEQPVSDVGAQIIPFPSSETAVEDDHEPDSISEDNDHPNAEQIVLRPTSLDDIDDDDENISRHHRGGVKMML